MTPLSIPTQDENTPRRLESECYVEGYATTFALAYTLWQDGTTVYREQIDAGAFENADLRDVIMQYDHMGKVLARQSNGTLIVEVNETGLFVAADLSKSVAARELYEEIQAGLITEMSFGFSIAANGIDYDEEQNLSTITAIEKVYDVSAVSIPANAATTISARSLMYRRSTGTKTQKSQGSTGGKAQRSQGSTGRAADLRERARKKRNYYQRKKRILED
jgi:phage prohead protease, HK97 family